MGLDITYYGRLEPVDATFSDGDEAYDAGAFRPYPNHDFPNHPEGLDLTKWYRRNEAGSFRAGSYSGYNLWRDQLAQVPGFNSAKQVWEGDLRGPFAELINFSDCEGTIGPVLSAKLAKDFEENRERARALWAGDDCFLAKYEKWAEAFKVAADGGCVCFD